MSPSISFQLTFEALNLELINKARLNASESKGPSCLYLSRVGVTGVYCCTWQFAWMLRIQAQGSSCLHTCLLTGPRHHSYYCLPERKQKAKRIDRPIMWLSIWIQSQLFPNPCLFSQTMFFWCLKTLCLYKATFSNSTGQLWLCYTHKTHTAATTLISDTSKPEAHPWIAGGHFSLVIENYLSCFPHNGKTVLYLFHCY